MALTQLAIKDLAEQTGVAAGTLRMWEQRYGFPSPERTPSGYRRYTQDDVDVIRKVLAYRERGLSVPAALARAREGAGTATDRPSIFGAVVTPGETGIPARVMRKPTLFAISKAIEDEAIARAAAPVVIGAFQDEPNYRGVEHRYRRLAAMSEVTVVFAAFEHDECRHRPGLPIELPIPADEALGNEWAVIVDAPGYAACLLAWESLDSRRAGDRADAARQFECIWTLDPHVVRKAAHVSARLARRSCPDTADALESALADRPLAMESPAPGLTALTNRMLSYMESAQRS